LQAETVVYPETPVFTRLNGVTYQKSIFTVIFTPERDMEVHLGDVPQAYYLQGAAFSLRRWSSLGYQERFRGQNLDTVCTKEILLHVSKQK
jgi:hypothetical protein